MIIRANGSTHGSVGGGEMEARVINEALASIGDGNLRTVQYELFDASKGDPGVCGGTVTVLIEPHLPQPTLFLIGCGHVGRAVSDLACWLGYRVVATDDREELATPELVPSAHTIFAGSFADAIAAHPIDSHTSVVLVTRNVAVDLAILPLLLQTEARYIGLMGSSRRWETTREKLIAAGVSKEDLHRISTPVGIEINAETPEEIAVSIMGQVVANRRKP
jgi:xanthine dehydrogenase accessory factor